MTVYYNENEPFAAQWLRSLIAAGHIAPGDVDERSIEDVTPGDLAGYRQCHFFAGIGVWSHALHLAGWPDDRPVWTGSCPCQPFSAAGKGGGFADERHLWPAWHHLIGQCRPDIIFGEQVESRDGLGWLDLVQADLEGVGYACGAAVVPAAGVGAPHQRHRLWFVAHPLSAGQPKWGTGAGDRPASRRRIDGGVVDTEAAERWSPGEAEDGRHGAEEAGGSEPSRVLAHGDRERLSRGQEQHGDSEETAGPSQRQHPGGRGELGHPDDAGLALGSVPEVGGRPLRIEGATLGAAEPVRGFWRGADWIWMRDGKYRPVEPGSFPLVDGAPGRVVRVCSSCVEKGAVDEKVRAMLGAVGRDEGLITSEILLQKVHGNVVHEAAHNVCERALPSPAFLSSGEVRSVRGAEEVGTASQRPGRDKQRAGEHHDSVPGMPRARAQGGSPCVGVLGLPKEVCGGEPPEPKQDMLCDLCGRVGAHLRAATLGSNRVGRLRAYGNAIVPQVAALILRAIQNMEDTK